MTDDVSAFAFLGGVPQSIVLRQLWTLGGGQDTGRWPPAADQGVHRASIPLPVRAEPGSADPGKGNDKLQSSQVWSAMSAGTFWMPIP